jgi:hypothetical protein
MRLFVGMRASKQPVVRYEIHLATENERALYESSR